MFFCFFQHFSPDLPSDGGQRRREQVHVRDTRLHGEQEGGKLRLQGIHNSHKKKKKLNATIKGFKEIRK